MSRERVVLPSPQHPIPFDNLALAHVHRTAMFDQARRAYLMPSGRVVVLEISDIECCDQDGLHASLTMITEGVRCTSNINRMPPGDLGRLAEVRSMMDDWMAGKIPAMPPSTALIPEGYFE